MRSNEGQASVETVVLVPVIAVCALGAWQVLMVAWTLVAAGDAAHAGARAVISHEPARPAIRQRAAGLDALTTCRCTIGDRELKVSVRVPSAIPGFSTVITASADLVRP